jgi:ABC-type xylose transport system permease subunit
VNITNLFFAEQLHIIMALGMLIVTLQGIRLVGRSVMGFRGRLLPPY